MRCAAAVVALTLTTLGLGATGEAYSGIGLAAVERALGRAPESLADLEGEIARREALLAGGDSSAATLYSTAILKLNRPTWYTLDEPRRMLGEAIVADPGYENALEVWIDLIPGRTDLGRVRKALEDQLGAKQDDAALLWAIARVAHLEGDHGRAIELLERAEGSDPEYRGRVQWQLAVIAGERDKDEDATAHFTAATKAIDTPTARLMWQSALLVSSRDDEIRYETTPPSAREDFFAAFWKQRDVFPLTDANERLGEHFRRLEKARQDFALQSNGRAYLTSHDTFKDRSPDLDYYASDVVFDYGDSRAPWLDHRGLVFVRHGVADRGTRASIGGRSETWLYYRWTSRPLLFHFIDRRTVGEMVITLNLAQATIDGSIPDDPIHVVGNATDFRELYGTRSTFHQLFQQISTSRSRVSLDELLMQEARMMGGFARDAWLDDTSGLIDKDDNLPFATYSVNYRADNGKIDTYVYYAIPEKELEKSEVPEFEFDATLVVFSDNWQEKLTSGEHHFKYTRPTGERKVRDDDLLVGVIELHDLEPGRYNFAFQVRERNSEKIGIAKGPWTGDYFGPAWVDVSDLLMAESIEPATGPSLFERNGMKIVPIPTRTVRRNSPGNVYFEIYDLELGLDGKTHYSVEYKILQIQKQPGIASKLFGIGMNVAYLFFPYQVFLAQAGLFGLDVATVDPEKGLDTILEDRATGPVESVVAEHYKFDTKKYPPGVYQLYVTVKDHVSGSLSTKSMRFAVSK